MHLNSDEVKYKKMKGKLILPLETKRHAKGQAIILIYLF